MTESQGSTSSYFDDRWRTASLSAGAGAGGLGGGGDNRNGDRGVAHYHSNDIADDDDDDDDDDDRYFKIMNNGPETETTTATPARTAAYSLEREFDCEAAAADDDDDDDDDNDNDNVLSEDKNSADPDEELPPPPPPREDVMDGDDDDDYNNDDGDEDGDGESMMENHVSRGHLRCSSDDNAHSSSSYGYGANNDNGNGNDDTNDNDNDISKLDSTFDNTVDIDNSTLFDGLSCGDDTMHVLMDADARLRTIPPSSGKKRDESPASASAMMAGRTSLHLQRHNDFEMQRQHQQQQQHLEKMRPLNNNPDFGMRMVDNNPDNSILTNGTFDDNMSTGLSTGVASLLRGPIMAAKSARANAKVNAADMRNDGGTDELGSARQGGFHDDDDSNDDSDGDGDGDTPSKARNAFPFSVQKKPGHAAGAGHGHAATPSTARNEFMAETVPTPSMVRNQFSTEANTPSAARSPPEAIAGYGGNGTPSAARNEFLASVQKLPPRPQSVESTRRSHSPGVYDDTMNDAGVRDGPGSSAGTPSQIMRREFIVSTQKPSRQRPPLRQLLHSQSSQLSPSAARENFLTSPQDSVSTIGTRSPSDGYLTMQQQQQQRWGIQQQPTPSTQRRLVISPQNSAHSLPSVSGSSPLSEAKYPLETPLSAGSNDGGTSLDVETHRKSPTLDQDVNQFIGDSMEHNINMMMSAVNNKARSANANSLESMIALGEEQMRTAVTAAAAVSINPSLPPKKPFLKKGMRREPSSLHKVSGSSSMNSAKSAVTPSTQQRRSNNNNTLSNNNVSHTPSNNVNSTAKNAANETLSERKARLARLEQMQEDLLKDLERRQERKEEARKDRQLLERQQKQKKILERQQRSAMKPSNTAAIAATPAVSVREAITPSQARARSAPPKKRIVGGKGVVEMTPSQIRDSVSGKAAPTRRSFEDEVKRVEDDDIITPSQARQNSVKEEEMSSQVRTRSIVKKLEVKEDITPSRARSMGYASKTSPSVDIDDHGYDEVDKDYEEEYDEGLADDVCIEGGEVSDSHEDGSVTNEKVHKGYSNSKSSSKQIRSKSTPRTRTSSQPPRSTSAAKRRIAHNGKTNNNSNASRNQRSSKQNIKASSSSNDDDKQAFEEWKRKEEEQWALIKNMRKRQEAALREAEGERERAKAWAAAEKETVEKWAKDQRAMIKKDRHKAANAALLATKKANKENQRSTSKDAEVEVEAMRIELEELRATMKKMKLGAGEETKRLKEHIHRQERMISTLRASKGPPNRGEEAMGDRNSPVSGAVAGPSRHKSPASNGGRERGTRQALGDRSSKHNTQQHHHQGSRPKTQQRRKSSEGDRGGALNGKQSDVVPERTLQAVEQEEENEVVDTLTEEPTEHWLQRHLSKLNNANNRLGSKMIDEGNVSNQYQQFGQRKPYNASDYGGKQQDDELPTQSLSRTDTSHSGSVPQEVVTALSPSIHPSETTEAGAGVDPAAGHDSNTQHDNHHQQAQEQATTKSQILTYKNGTQKEVLLDGTMTISFANGDRKRTYANEKKGIVVYYYAATKTTQVTHQDGMQTYHFPNKQIENHYADGRKEITFPDGTVRMVHMDGMCDTTFADGVRVIDYPDGTQRVMQ